MIVKISKILKNKRGVAMENAILFMLIIFSLCALMTSLTVIGHYQVKIEQTTLLGEIELDQIGEDYLASVKNGEEFTNTYERYVYEVSGNSLTVKRRSDGSVALYVQTDDEQNVIAWRYS